MDWVCAACGAQWAPGAPRCPECPSTVHVEVVEVPKILPNGQVTYEADVPREPAVAADDAELRQKLAGVKQKLADLEATATPAGDVPVREPAVAPKSPPRVPPRRTPPGVTGA